MKNKLFRLVLSLAVGLACLLLWLHLIDTQELLSYLHRIRPLMVAGAGLTYVFSYLLRSLRWRTILSTIQRVPPGRTFLYFMAATFMNYLVPIRAGELAKCYFVKKHYGTRVSRTLPTVFIDKLFDSAAIFLVLALIPFLPVKLNASLWTLIFILLGVVLLGLGVMLAASLAHQKTTTVLMKLLFFVPRRYQSRLEDVSSLFVEGVGLFRHHTGLLPQISLLTLLAVLSDSFVVMQLFWAFGVQVNFWTVLFGYTLIYLSYILPHPPAQIGSNELLMILIFSVGFGLERTLAGTVMAFGHLLTGMLIVVLGMAALSWTGTGLFRFSADDDDEEDEA